VSGSAAANPQPLAGVLVADFSRILAGPLVTQSLADLGADVIKVERPVSGDDTRAWSPPSWEGGSTYFASVNHNKRSVTLDLNASLDRARAHTLAGRADVLVENFRPGLMASFGLGYDDLVDRNPGLVYASISAFGTDGEAASMPGVDLLIQAMAGWMHVTGPSDGPPTKVGMAVVDVVAGLYTTIGVLAALGQRSERDGRGQRVDVSLFDSALGGLVNFASGHLLAGDDPVRNGNRHPSIAPYELVRASDRSFVLAAINDELFLRTCETIDRADLIVDPRFITNTSRREHADELLAELEGEFSRGLAADWIERLRAARVPVGPVNTVAEAIELSDRLGIDSIITDPDTGFRSVRFPVSLSGSSAQAPTKPPGVDADGDDIRAWLDGSEPLDG
jgi:crotonobetainyl-CoA:carnitine CoA-transferase CaiB-like acyl-CoA transferase